MVRGEEVGLVPARFHVSPLRTVPAGTEAARGPGFPTQPENLSERLCYLLSLYFMFLASYRARNLLVEKLETPYCRSVNHTWR